AGFPAAVPVTRRLPHRLPLPARRRPKAYRNCILQHLEPRQYLSAVVWANIGSDWNTGLNWVGGVAPGINDTAVFATAPIRTNPTIAAATSVGGITIDDSGGPYNILQTGSQTLTIGSGGIVVNAPTSTTADTTTINPNINLTASQTWTTTNNIGSTEL